MSNVLKTPQAGQDPLASDAGQYTMALSGTADVGTLQLTQPQATPSAPTATAGATGNLNGAYKWIVVLVTGWQQADGSYYVGGFAPSADSVSVTLTNTAASLSNIATGATGTIGRLIYRTAAGGASGTEKYVGYIWDNTTTTFTDNIADANLGTGMPTSSSTPAVYGNAIPANVPTSNTTGTNIAGINALAHGPSLTGLWHFENDLNTTRGLQGSFSRGSAANDPTTLANSFGNNVPRFQSGKYGSGLFIEEGTTNLVNNSDFEVFTGTANVFNDNMQQGTAWTVQSGAATFGTGGATATTTPFMVAGSTNLRPFAGSNGSYLQILGQATFTTPASLTSGYVNVDFVASPGFTQSNRYYAEINLAGNTFYIAKQTTSGGQVTMSNVVTPSTTIAANTTYTIQFVIDSSNNYVMTAKLYAGTGTGGTLLGTATVTNEYTFPVATTTYQFGLYMTNSCICTNATVNAPIPDTWSAVNYDGGYPSGAIALVPGQGVNGNNALQITRPGTTTNDTYVQSSLITVSSSTTYTVSAYINAQSLTASNNSNVGVRIIEWTTGQGTVTYDSAVPVSISSPTNGYQRVVFTWTTKSNTAELALRLQLNGAGSVLFDAIQLEQKAYATSYLRNDSTSASATRNDEIMTIPAQGVLNASAGTVSMWWIPSADSIGGTSANSDDFKWLFGGFNGSTEQIRLAYTPSNQYFHVAIAGQSDTNSSAYALASGVAYHIVLKWDTKYNQAKLYVNGVPLVTTTAPTITLNGSAYVGCWNASNYQCNGVIDELAIFNRALQDAEVFSLYYASVPLQDALAKPISPDLANYNASMSSPDSNDIYTVVTYKRADGTVYMISTASNPDANNNYQTFTWKYYDATGTVVLNTVTWAVTYDSYGKITQRVMQ